MDRGEVQYPGWLGRLFGRKPRILRDADMEAAMASLPETVSIVKIDDRGNWILYVNAEGKDRIRFRAWEAWFPNEPTLTRKVSNQTSATVLSDGRVVVTEGLHRARGMARDRVIFKVSLGCVLDAPGWLDFVHDETKMRDTPSSRAIAEMMGGDLDAPLISAR